MTARKRTPSSPPGALGVIRVSQVAGREGERFASPDEQRERIETVCEREGLELLECLPELNVSGGAGLEQRTGLLRAVEAVESGHARVIVVAYFDRLVRSLAVQAEVLDRVERAGGRVLAADVGEVGQDTAARWLSATMLGMVAEYFRRSTAERVAGAQRRAVEQGRPPFPLIDGLRRTAEGAVEIDPATADAVREAVRMRAEGETFAVIRAHLKKSGIERSYHGTQSLLRSRMLVGEIVFGDLRGTVPALVDRDMWELAQRASVPRGRRPRSERLLARLGVLRCGTCGSRLVVGLQTQNGRSYPFYRCGRVREDCRGRVTISAEHAEARIVDAVREHLTDAEGLASTSARAAEAREELEAAQANLDAAIRAFAGLDGEVAARERLEELRVARDAAQERAERLGRDAVGLTVTVAKDWDRLTITEQREIIRAVVGEAIVRPGRGGDRLEIKLLGQ